MLIWRINYTPVRWLMEILISNGVLLIWSQVHTMVADICLEQSWSEKLYSKYDSALLDTLLTWINVNTVLTRNALTKQLIVMPIKALNQHMSSRKPCGFSLQSPWHGTFSLWGDETASNKETNGLLALHLLSIACLCLWSHAHVEHCDLCGIQVTTQSACWLLMS